GALQVGAECTKRAAVNADVGRVQVRVDVVIGELAVLPLADDVRQLAQREQVRVVVEIEAVVEREPLAGLDFFTDRGETSIGVQLHVWLASALGARSASDGYFFPRLRFGLPENRNHLR